MEKSGKSVWFVIRITTDFPFKVKLALNDLYFFLPSTNDSACFK